MTSPQKIGVVRDDNQRDDNSTYVAARGLGEMMQVDIAIAFVRLADYGRIDVSHF